MKKTVLVFTVLVLVWCFGCVSSERVTSSSDQSRGDNVGETGQGVEVFPQLGHTLCVNSIAVGSSGKYILSGSQDSTLKLWDITTGREIRSFIGHVSDVYSVAISSDEKYALSGAKDTTLKLWDIATGQMIRTFMGHTNTVMSVCFSPDRKHILSGSVDKTLKLWDIATGQVIRTFEGHKDWVRSVAISPDGKYVLSGSGSGFRATNKDYTIKMWDITTGREIRTFAGHKDIINSIAVSSDGKYVISGSSDRTLRLWDIVTGREIRAFIGHNDTVETVAVSHDGKHLFSGSRDKTINLWDISSGQLLRTFEGHKSPVNSIAICFDGEYIISGSGNTIITNNNKELKNNAIKQWDITTGQVIRTFESNASLVHSSAISPDGKHIFSGDSWDNTFKQWNIATGQMMRTFGHNIKDDSFIISPDGKFLLSGSSNFTFKLWDINTGIDIKTFTGHDWVVDSIAISPDGKFAISFGGFSDKTIKMWDIASGQMLRSFSGPYSNVYSLAFSRDGKYALSGSYDRTLKLWEIDTGNEIKTFRGHNGTVFSVNFSSDGRYVFSGSEDKTLKMWEITTGSDIKTFTGHTHWIISIAVSPDNKYILSGSRDNTIRLWDMTTGDEVRTFEGHTSSVNSVSFSSDGKRVLSCSNDGTVCLWSTATGKEIAKFISFSGTDTQLTANARGSDADAAEKTSDISSEWICVTPDGYYAASPLGDRYINVRVGNRVTGMDSFRHIFYNPDVVAARLAGRPDPVTKKTVNIKDALSFFPSTLTLQTPATTATSTANLTVTVSDDYQPVKNIKILVNGRLVGRDELAGLNGAQGLVPEKASITVTGEQKSFSFNIPLSVNPGQNLIEVIALNGYEAESRQKITLTRQTDASYRPQLPKLWILAVGVNDYDNARTDKLPFKNLNFCANDAREMVNTFKALGGKRYAKVESLLLASGETGETLKPTAANILNNLSFFDQADPNDIIFLFLAGHGINDENGMFYFLPQDAVIQGNNYSNVISGDEISSVLDTPGNRLIFIDACHSGGEDENTKRWVDNDRMLKQLMDTNAYVFASCKGNESSHEDSPDRNFWKWNGHGVFTYSILETFKQNRTAGIFSMMDLSGTVKIDVPRRMNNQQNPVGYSLGFYDFIIGE
jgi:WD40 repeat protein